jgi:hypothetical protein
MKKLVIIAVVVIGARAGVAFYSGMFRDPHRRQDRTRSDKVRARASSRQGWRPGRRGGGAMVVGGFGGGVDLAGHR